MIRSISVRLLVSVELLEFAESKFFELMQDPGQREDALQELRMVEMFSARADLKAKLALAKRALTWLTYERSPEILPRPRCRKPKYTPLPKLEEGTFLADLSLKLEAARLHERMVA